LVFLACFAVLVVALVLGDTNALCLFPALALAVPLSMRRYPGERIVARLSKTGRARRVPARGLAPNARRRLPNIARGGLLIARSLAVRPPPAVLSPAS
jgi:hypothetical protein